MSRVMSHQCSAKNTPSTVHTIAGGYNFGPTLDYKTLLASKCTSTGVKEDKSAYWVMQLFRLCGV